MPPPAPVCAPATAMVLSLCALGLSAVSVTQPFVTATREWECVQPPACSPCHRAALPAFPAVSQEGVNATVRYYTKHVCVILGEAQTCVTWETAESMGVACCGMQAAYAAVGVLSFIALACEAVGGVLACCGVRGTPPLSQCCESPQITARLCPCVPV